MHTNLTLMALMRTAITRVFSSRLPPSSSRLPPSSSRLPPSSVIKFPRKCDCLGVHVFLFVCLFVASHRTRWSSGAVSHYILQNAGPYCTCADLEGCGFKSTSGQNRKMYVFLSIMWRLSFTNFHLSQAVTFSIPHFMKRM